LRDPDPGVRDGAAVALGQIRRAAWDEAVAALCDVLRKDADGGARRSAAFALGSLAEALLAAREHAARPADTAREAARADVGPAVRQNAAWALGQFGGAADDQAVAKLVRLLGDADGLVRRDAAGALGVVGQAARTAVPALLSCFRDDAEA